METRIVRARAKSSKAKWRKYGLEYCFYLHHFWAECRSGKEWSFDAWLANKHKDLTLFDYYYWFGAVIHTPAKELQQRKLERRGKAHRGNYHHHHYASHYR
jgi:hypothetical protein